MKDPTRMKIHTEIGASKKSLELFRKLVIKVYKVTLELIIKSRRYQRQTLNNK